MSILAYVKPTNYCNVGCTHCYLPESVRADRFRMSFETVEHAARLLADMQARGRHQGAIVLWHGGEPLTIPPDWFEQAGEILDRHLPGHQQAIQTSLIPYRREYASLVNTRFGGEIGTSVDFTQRMIKGSVSAYHALWMQKVDMAREDGIGIVAGMVPTKNDLGHEAEIVQFFVDRDLWVFNIDRYNQFGGDLPDWPTNREHALFLIGVFEACLDHMERHGVAPLAGAVVAGIRGVLYQVPGDRWGGTCQSDFVVVEPDGGLNTCPDKSSFEPPYSFAADGFEAFAKSRFRRKWIRTQHVGHKRDHCATCENNVWCHSGCPITPNGPADGQEECAGYKTFLDHIRRTLAEPDRRALVLAYLAQDVSFTGAEAPTRRMETPPVPAAHQDRMTVEAAE